MNPKKINLLKFKESVDGGCFSRVCVIEMLVCCTKSFNTMFLEDLSLFGTSFHEVQGILGI